MGSSQSMVTGTALYDSFVEDDTKLSDLKGKVVAVTGTSPGSIGYYIAEAAVKKQAAVVILLNRISARSVSAQASLKALAAKNDNTVVHTVPIDLLKLSTVAEAAVKVNEIASQHGGLDVLCCNAGIMAMDDERTEDGFNLEVQADHLSHAKLTKDCLPSLQQASVSRGEARIVFQSSSARHGPPLDAKYFQKCEPMTLGGNGTTGPWMRYTQAKLANAAFAMALHDVFSQSEAHAKIKSMGVDPGYSTSNLQGTSKNTGYVVTAVLNLIHCVGGSQSPADGALPAAVACFGPDADSGDFFLPNGRLNLAGAPTKSIAGGVQVTKDPEAVDAHNKTTVMEATLKAFGWESFV